MLKVIIAGSRGFGDYYLLANKCSKILIGAMSKDGEVEIVSGGADGADKLGERYAAEKGLSVKLFPADWKQYGKAAGPLRNKQMAEYADALIAFWDGVSPGTKDMIEQATAKGLKTRVIYF